MFGPDTASRAGLPVVESQEPAKLEKWSAKSRAITAKRLANSAEARQRRQEELMKTQDEKEEPIN